jgi:hypothetical protein
MRVKNQTTNMEYQIYFSDLEANRQGELVSSESAKLYGELEKEANHGKYGENFGRAEYKHLSWQEAICREYSIDYLLWETKEEAKKFDWDFAVKTYCDDEAIKKLESYTWTIETK